MKFRGLIGPRSGSHVPEVDETSARTTGTDAETAGIKANATDNAITEPGSSTPHGDGSFDEKNGAVADNGIESLPVEELQYGVQLAQATLKVWSRNQLIAAYVL